MATPPEYLLPRSSGYQRSYTQADWDMLAQVVYGEARGESYDGQVAVAAVVLNRLEDSQFPNTLSGVVISEKCLYLCKRWAILYAAQPNCL